MELLTDVAVAAEENAACLRPAPPRDLLLDGPVDIRADADADPVTVENDPRVDCFLSPALTEAVATELSKKQESAVNRRAFVLQSIEPFCKRRGEKRELGIP